MLRNPSLMKLSRAMILQRQRNLICLTAVTALASSSQAWILPTTVPHGAMRNICNYDIVPQKFTDSTNRNIPQGPRAGPCHPVGSTRLYSGGNNDESPGFLAKLGKAAKKLLPTKIFGTEEEKQKLQKRKEVKDQVSGGLDNVLKDAPLGVRMMGKMISPLVSGLASTMAETMAEQQKSMEGVMDDARRYLMNDPAVSNLLGEPISLGAPFSQSSSTSSINGMTQSRVELAMPVSGSRMNGTVRVSATQDGIAQMMLDAGGQRINVSLLDSPKFSSSGGSSPFTSGRVNGDDNIIEAEIIDKSTRK